MSRVEALALAAVPPGSGAILRIEPPDVFLTPDLPAKSSIRRDSPSEASRLLRLLFLLMVVSGSPSIVRDSSSSSSSIKLDGVAGLAGPKAASSTSSSTALALLLPDSSFFVGEDVEAVEDPKENHDRRPGLWGVEGGVGTFEGPAFTAVVIRMNSHVVSCCLYGNITST